MSSVECLCNVEKVNRGTYNQTSTYCTYCVVYNAVCQVGKDKKVVLCPSALTI